MIGSIVKIAAGVGLYNVGKYIGQRDVNIKVGKKVVGGDTRIAAAFVAVVAGGALVGSGIGDFLK